MNTALEFSIEIRVYATNRITDCTGQRTSLLSVTNQRKWLVGERSDERDERKALCHLSLSRNLESELVSELLRMVYVYTRSTVRQCFASLNLLYLRV